jgi:hypothetical protein
MYDEIPAEIRGWWRILETSQWGNKKLDILGPALRATATSGEGAGE